jgi:hypothetical protein
MADPELLAGRLRDELAAACNGDDRRLYVVLDAARVKGVRSVLRRLEVPHACLYRGSAEGSLAHVAPYLASLALEGPVLAWMAYAPEVLESALVAVANAELEPLRTHLRRYLLVSDAVGHERHFRMYDPRVLAPFLAASDEAERRKIFGPIKRFLAQEPDAGENAERDAAAPVLVGWEAPPAPPPLTADASTIELPNIWDRFALRAAHEEAFARAMLARYERRCVAYLRACYPVRLADASDERLRAVVTEARGIADRLALPGSLDVTTVAELLVLTVGEAVVAAVEHRAVEDRPVALEAMRDELAASAATVALA